MGFTCPACKQVKSLIILHSLELPADGRSDEIALQIIACENCGFKGMAVYEESRRGSEDSFHHDGYFVSKTSLARLEQMIEACPAPGDRDCLCQTHQVLRAVDKSGAWKMPFNYQDSFPMIWKNA